MKTQLLCSRNSSMQKCRKMFYFCIFTLLHFSFIPSTFAQNVGDIKTFTDSRDGQSYKAVFMPDVRWWMAENLKFHTGLNNPVFADHTTANTLAALKNTYYCPGFGPLNTSQNKQSDPLSCEYWGALYPWWAANSTAPGYGICPNGWHLPTDFEWQFLIDLCGGANAGKLLKDSRRGDFDNNQSWNVLWTNAASVNSDAFGFKVLAAGLRTAGGTFDGNGTQAHFWTSTPVNETDVAAGISRGFGNKQDNVSRNALTTNLRSNAYSVRCVEGECKETMNATLSPVTQGCNQYRTVASFDVIEFIPGQIKYQTFAISGLSGASYTTPVISDIPSGVSITSSAIASNQFTLTISGITNRNLNAAFKIKLTATHPKYCGKMEQEFVIRLQMYGNNGYFTDARDGKEYRAVKMPDGKWWMAEDLNYRTGLSQGSQYYCYNNNAADCDAYGALYTFTTAMSLNGVGGFSNSTYCGTLGACHVNAQAGGRGVCPVGWHVPTDLEWKTMYNTIENITGGLANQTNRTGEFGTNAANYLRKCNDMQYDYSAIDRYGFSVRARGGYNTDPFDTGWGLGYVQQNWTAFFWTSSPQNSLYARYNLMYIGWEKVAHYEHPYTTAFGVRCVAN